MILWVEPALDSVNGGTVSGGLRYNQQLRKAMDRLGAQTSTLSAPPPQSDDDVAHLLELIRSQQRELTPQLTVVDGLLGSRMPELFLRMDEPSVPSQVLLVHLPVAAELEAEGMGDPEAVKRERTAVQEADHVVAVSQWGAAELRRRYRRQEITVAEPGVQVPDALTSVSVRENDDAPLSFVCVATWNPLKNHRLLLEALKPLVGMNWRLVLAGPGADQEPGAGLLAQMQKHLAGHVDHRGLLSPEGVSALWPESDLLLLPSLVETYGMVVTEACSYGVPAFVASGTGAVEAASEAGLALDPRDAHAWTTALHRFLTSPELRHELTQAAQRRRHHLPTWGQPAEVILSLR